MLRIGNIELQYGLVLAPLAGFSDSSFRRLCKSFGAELVFSEMVSAEGVRRGMKRTLDYLFFTEEERPIGIQLFGAKEESMKQAAGIVEEDFHPEVIDINLGCPVKKVIKTGAGAALLKDMKKMEKIVKAVVKAVKIPVSAKIRLGWSQDDSLEISKMLQDCGVNFITVHSRRAIDDYSQKSDWMIFEKLKAAITIPIVANGDIMKPEDTVFLISHVGVDAVMIGRAALGKPWLFEMIKEYINNGSSNKEVTRSDRMDILLSHIEMLKQRIGEEKTVRRIKGQIGYYLKDIENTKRIKQEILKTRKLNDMVVYIQRIKN